MNSPATNNLAERAQACLDMGDLQQATSLFNELRVIEPDNAEAWLMSGALLGETGAVDEAAVLVQKAVDIKPNYPEAYLTLAHLNKAGGDDGQSYALVKKALDIDSNYDEAWVFLGAVCCDLGRYEEAENASREAIRRWPENTQAHISLATALCNLGREDEAEPEARQAIELEGGNLPSINPLLARILLGKCEYDEAETIIRSALTVAPTDVILLLNLANIKLGQKQFDLAAQIFQNIIDAMPDKAEAWTGLGTAYQEQNNFELAETSYKKAMEFDVASQVPAYKLAQLYEANGRFDESEAVFRGILEQYPGQLDTVGALAGLLEKAGKIYDAIDTIEPVLSIPERSVPVGLAYQKLCDKMESCADAINYLNDLLQTPALHKEDESAVRFSLGGLYDKQGDFDAAFEQFSIANELNAENYNPDDYTAYITNMINVYSANAIKSLPRSTSTTEAPVFIVGMPRSGTSLVEQILSSHSEVFGAGELRKITELTEKISSIQTAISFPENTVNLTQSEMDILSDEYIQFISSLSNGAKRVTDKLPHNFQYIGLISSLFPNAKIIHCRRDAKDTCLSCYSMNFFGHHPYTSSLNFLGRHYKDYERLMEHWKKLDISILEVNYEDLINAPEKKSQEIIEYCGLDWQEQCLRFYENESRTRTASYNQVRQPIYDTAIGRWNNYQTHLLPLTEVLDINHSNN